MRSACTESICVSLHCCTDDSDSGFLSATRAFALLPIAINFETANILKTCVRCLWFRPRDVQLCAFGLRVSGPGDCVVSIRWHRVHTCQCLVLAIHTQRVHFGLRDNARRLCPRTELSEQYMFPFASNAQSVWRLQHVGRPLVLACFMQRVDHCFHGNAQKLFRLRAALEPYCYHWDPFSASIATASMPEAHIDRV